MIPVELTADEADVIANLLRGWSIPVCDPNAPRLVAAAQSILKKLTDPEPTKG